jgi:ATP-dependent phosphofructokinase / diphosphate-dependent phosphofructokinase
VRAGVLTGGGDCPGLNAAIRAIVRRAEERGLDLVGFRQGWRGVLEGDAEPLTGDDVRGILPRGGTILGTSGVQPHRLDRGVERVAEAISIHRLDGFVVIGGEGTIGETARLGVPAVGVPKTIDNDIRGTGLSIGFQTAAEVATELLDRLHSTAESHDRVIVVEVMGRHAGWIALHSGLAGGADAILIPEVPFDVGALAERLQHRHTRGAGFSIVVVAEGAVPREGTMETVAADVDEFGHVRLGGIAMRLAPEVAQRTGFETRVVVLGHLLRGGTPTAYDRILATRFGLAAVDAVVDGDYDQMVALHGTDIVRVPLADAVGQLKVVPPERFAEAEVFFG